MSAMRSPHQPIKHVPQKHPRTLRRQDSSDELRLVDRVTFFKNWQNSKYAHAEKKKLNHSDDSTNNLMNTSALNQNEYLVDSNNNSIHPAAKENVYSTRSQNQLKTNMSNIQRSSTTDEKLINISDIEIDNNDADFHQIDINLLAMPAQPQIKPMTVQNSVQKSSEDRSSPCSQVHMTETMKYRNALSNEVQKNTSYQRSSAASQNSVIHLPFKEQPENGMKQIKSKFSLQELEQEEKDKLAGLLDCSKSSDDIGPTTSSQQQANITQQSTSKSSQQKQILKSTPDTNKITSKLVSGQTTHDIPKQKDKIINNKALEHGFQVCVHKLKQQLFEHFKIQIDEAQLQTIVQCKCCEKMQKQLQSFDTTLKNMINQLPKTSDKTLLKQLINKRLQKYDTILSNSVD